MKPPMNTALRSMLFVPAVNERFVRKALEVRPDAVVLDLEASIPEQQKDQARDCLAKHICFLKNNNIIVIVRVNRDLIEDYHAAINFGADALMLPCVEVVDQVTNAFESVRHLKRSHAVGWLPIIETPMGLLNVRAIASLKVKLWGLLFGAEDFVLRLGDSVDPSEAALFNGAWQTSVTASAYGLPCYGIAGTVADFRQDNAFRRLCEQAKSIGMASCPAIHPRQIEIVHEVFQPSAEELVQAQQIIQQFNQAEHSVMSLNGQMIDYPIYYRAKKLLQKAKLNHD